MKKYIRTFSKREILSALFSALMMFFVPFVAIILYEIFPDNIFFFVLYCIFCAMLFALPLALSYRFYLLEHRRSNSFGGRILHDSLIALFLFIIYFAYFHIKNKFYTEVGYISNLVILVVAIILISEIMLLLIGLILKLLKWRVW